jgi:hypothetical protein
LKNTKNDNLGLKGSEAFFLPHLLLLIFFQARYQSNNQNHESVNNEGQLYPKKEKYQYDVGSECATKQCLVSLFIAAFYGLEIEF